MDAHEDMKKDDGISYECVSVASTNDLRIQQPRVRTWGNDSIHEEQRRWDWRSQARWRVRWNWSLHEAWLRFCHVTRWTVMVVRNFPIVKHLRLSKKQLFAFFLVFASAVAPMIALGHFTPKSNRASGTFPFAGIFEDKTMSCGESFYGQPQNATVSGIEKLFALDQTFGRFSFSQVKTIDILWDLVVGRGLQLLAWWAAYTVFSDALLRAIERHPASFSIFQRIALEGPGLHSLWTLTKELCTAKSRRTKALFFYMFWSTAYVLFVPIVLGAMTGYDSTSIAWVDLDSSNNIVPASVLKESWIIRGTKNETWPQNVCKDQELQWAYSSAVYQRELACDCQLPNGTIVTKEEVARSKYSYYSAYPIVDCIYNYPNNTQTFLGYDYMRTHESTMSCNSTISVDIDGMIYDAQDLTLDSGYCYNSVGYSGSYLYDKSRCLPDTADPTYQWGFSTLMSGLFVFFTTGWVLSMYVVWQDAQFNSTLVKEGYNMTPLRAAFAMAKAAKNRTGLGEKQLVRANTKDLEKELYGAKGKKRTKVEYGLFVDDLENGDEDRQRPTAPRKTEEQLSSPVMSDEGERVQYISDEELRARYQKGVQEARLSRKPLSSDPSRRESR